VADVLNQKNLCTLNQIKPRPGENAIVATAGVLKPAFVCFHGTPPIVDFGYDHLFELARAAVQVQVPGDPPIRTVTTIAHGMGFGLDVAESLSHILAGFEAAILDGAASRLERIRLVERDARRARLLQTAVEKLPRPRRTTGSVARDEVTHRRAIEPRERPHIFVAMPFSDEFEDVYQFGIYEPVRRSGFICEHVGQAAFTGDVLQRIRDRIASAKLVIADLSSARPNVYLEVGFAWGQEVPVIFLARNGEELHFDVSTHRCIFYRNIKHLATELTQLLANLSTQP
jgi:hypothetical protein